MVEKIKKRIEKKTGFQIKKIRFNEDDLFIFFESDIISNKVINCAIKTCKKFGIKVGVVQIFCTFEDRIALQIGSKK